MRTNLFCLILALSACGQELKEFPASDQFRQHEIIGRSNSVLLQEASGLAVSFANPGHLWTHNDSGGEPALYLINEKGEVVLTLNLQGAENIDWEDMAITRDGTGIIYVGDIGDNRAERRRRVIYRINEPKLGASDEMTVPSERMVYQYAEGARDSETLMVDPFTGDLVLLTKREKQILVYTFPFESGTTTTISAKGSMDLTQLTAGDINENGDVLIKSYDQVFLLKNENETPIINLLLEGSMQLVDYEVEKQGEALTWSRDAKSFYLLSEWNHNRPQPLYRYY